MKRYEIRLPCAYSDMLAAAFPEMDALAIAPAATLLVGVLKDQTELHSVLERIAEMGLEITEVRQEP